MCEFCQGLKPSPLKTLNFLDERIKLLSNTFDTLTINAAPKDVIFNVELELKMFIHLKDSYELSHNTIANKVSAN